MSERLTWLATGRATDGSNPGADEDGRPRNFLEAVQLVFTLHACLHMTCEPVSVGRIDVLLEEYFQSGKYFAQNPLFLPHAKSEKIVIYCLFFHEFINYIIYNIIIKLIII